MNSLGINIPKKIGSDMCNVYLRMAAEALGQISHNLGGSRKEIWAYLMKHFEQKHLDYQTFLLAINQLLQDGKMTRNDNGFYFIESEVYSEMYKRYEDGKNSSGQITTGKGSASKRSAGGLPCSEYRRAKSFLMSSRTSAPGSGSNGKNYCGSFDKVTAKKSGGKISTKLSQPHRQGLGTKSQSSKYFQPYDDVDRAQFIIEKPIEKKELENGGNRDIKVPDVEKDPMEDLSKKIMQELKTLFPERRQTKNTGNVTPSVAQGARPAGKIEGSHNQNKGAQLGFKQASTEQSQDNSQQHPKSPEKDEDYQSKRDLALKESEKAVRIKKEKEKELLFGLTTPEKSEEPSRSHSQSQSQPQEQKGEEITTPEDLYPEKTNKRTSPKTNPLDNTGLIEALKHSKVENDDLNFNSEDERDISEMQQNDHFQYSPPTKGRAGGSNRKKRKEHADQNSQFSVISNYQLRPRNELSKVSQITATQRKFLQRGHHSVQKVATTNSKIVDKQNRKDQLIRSNKKAKEFKSPIAIEKRCLNLDVDQNMLSGENQLSDQSTKTQGFGSYKTRSYQAFENATNQPLTRRKLSDIVAHQPQIAKLIEKESSYEPVSLVGQKRFFNNGNQSNFEKYRVSSMSKIQKTSDSQMIRTGPYRSQSHFTVGNRTSAQSLQMKKKLVHQQYQRESLQRRSVFTSHSGAGRSSTSQTQHLVQGYVKASSAQKLTQSRPLKTPASKPQEQIVSQISTRSRRSPLPATSEVPAVEIKQTQNHGEQDFQTQSGRQTVKQNYKDANKQGFKQQVVQQQVSIDEVNKIAALYGQKPVLNIPDNQQAGAITQIRQHSSIPMTTQMRLPTQNGNLIGGVQQKPENQSQSTSISGDSLLTPYKKSGQQRHRSSGQKRSRESKMNINTQYHSQKY